MANLISRRSAIAGGAAALALHAAPAYATFSCAGYDGGGTQQCAADIQLDALAPARQQCRNWCWAACIETIFALNGHRLDQAKIVQKISGRTDCSTPVDRKMIDAISGVWTDDKGKRFLAEGIFLGELTFATWSETEGAAAAKELADGNPLISTALGHACVMSAMSFLQNRGGRMVPLGFTLHDPWPGNAVIRKLAAQDTRGTGLLAVIRFG